MMQKSGETRHDVAAVLSALLDSVQQCQEGLSQAREPSTAANATQKATKGQRPPFCGADLLLATPTEKRSMKDGVEGGTRGADKHSTSPQRPQPSCSRSPALGSLLKRSPKGACCSPSGPLRDIDNTNQLHTSNPAENNVPKAALPGSRQQCQGQESQLPESPTFIQRSPGQPAHSPQFEARQTHTCVTLQQLLRSSRSPSPVDPGHALQEACQLAPAERQSLQMQGEQARQQVDHVQEVSTAIAAQAEQVWSSI
jgi:hypothetical protein